MISDPTPIHACPSNLKCGTSNKHDDKATQMRTSSSQEPHRISQQLLAVHDGPPFNSRIDRGNVGAARFLKAESHCVIALQSLRRLELREA